MKTISSLFLCVVLPLSFSVVAESKDDNNEFKVHELRQIRGVSQAILKVRGQARREAIEETKDIRAEVAQINKMMQSSLEQYAMVDFRGRNNVLVNGSVNAVVATEELAPEERSVANRIKRAWRNIVKRDARKIRPNATREDRLNKRLDKMLAIAKTRKEKTEKIGPSMWEFWEKPTQKNTRIIHAMTKLKESLENIQSAEGEEKRKLARAFLDRSKQKLNRKPADPTLTSITKHIRK